MVIAESNLTQNFFECHIAVAVNSCKKAVNNAGGLT